MHVTSVHIRVLHYPVRQVVLRGKSQNIRFNPDKRIFADQNNRPGMFPGFLFPLIIQCNSQNPVIISNFHKSILHLGKASVI